MLRPKKRNGEWLTPYNPELGRNFEPAPGYIEGNAWNYRFYVPHDTPGLIKQLGGQDKFLQQLELTFSTGNFDMANEPGFDKITIQLDANYYPGKSLTIHKQHSRAAAGQNPVLQFNGETLTRPLFRISSWYKVEL